MIPTILLVEDNELNRDMLSRRLERKGYRVRTAVDSQDLDRQMAIAAPDLVLMDISLPGKDGYQITRELKTNPLTAAIPIIALTAHALSTDREKALAAGCDEYDTKPVELPRLMAKINALLGR
jgi:CheY-like chemotaxis protein